MKVEMTQAMAGLYSYRAPGEVYNLDDEEAERLIEKGFAKEAEPGAKAVNTRPRRKKAYEQATTR